ncbi:cupin domain-containing protein [Thalassolituus sp. UBA2590]|uniref:cupin domain-containing protein n=1 Tax=Thalassolituus sp. UBA2590 TaxID=1947663 RepID=UPI002647E04B|nr:cupin domain-containing protein [Thalassolituus sp. UBA2590]|tara:strand:+ start:745 stop:1899 length:1155 start_codon:yes stop_codon:yes gene_type:complete
MHVLGHLSVDEFLRDYWQKKPVLIRQAIPGFKPLLAADELAGLSLEEDIESRLIAEEGATGPWEVKKGPFTETDYRDLPHNKWTLLVQAVDQWVPEAAELLEHFRFIPSWRIDDLMISYATDGGSVGPHWDQYDVFLLQAEGQREWRVGQMCSEKSSILEGPSVKILADFAETDRWVLEPGDMLYLPPGLAHWGISQGECMTYSIGFRAPSSSELLERAIDSALPQLTEDDRYSDPDLSIQSSPSEITGHAAERLKTLLIKAIDDPALLKATLGQLMTEAKYDEQAPVYEVTDHDWADTVNTLQEADQWGRHPQARFAYNIDDSSVAFYCQGEVVRLPVSCCDTIKQLCDSPYFDSEWLIGSFVEPETKNLLSNLIFCDLIVAI